MKLNLANLWAGRRKVSVFKSVLHLFTMSLVVQSPLEFLCKEIQMSLHSAYACEQYTYLYLYINLAGRSIWYVKAFHFGQQ